MKKLERDISKEKTRKISKLRELFPHCVTEIVRNEASHDLAIDFDLLRQELSDEIVEGPQERCQLNWPGKRQALLAANDPILHALRPCHSESVNYETTRNLFIEGDNLKALKLLQEAYLGAVKMIYIDPPYNTGGDFVYNDTYSERIDSFLLRSGQTDNAGNNLVTNTESNGRFHSDWLSMMYPRLRVARNLLSSDGIIFISIDDGEGANLRKICDEIFGEDNFVAQIAWEKRYTRSNNAKRFYSLKDTILVYRRSEALEHIKEDRTAKADANYRNIDDDPRGPWMTSSYVNPATKAARPKLVYGIPNPITGEMVTHPTHAWKYSKKEYEKHVAEERLWWGRNGNAEYPRLKLYLNEQTGGLVPVDLWDYKSTGTTDEGGSEIKEIFGEAVFDTPKPTRLIERMLGIATDPKSSDIVLDFFCGSASTAHAVIKKNLEDGGNRKFIMVQLPEPTAVGTAAHRAGLLNIAEIAKERIRRVGRKIISETQPCDWKGDVGFRVLKLDSSNLIDVERSPEELSQADLLDTVGNVKSDRTPEDLLIQVLLDWGVDLTFPIRREILQGKTVFFVNEPPYDLVACFDTEISEDLVKELASYKPLRVVFRDSGFVSDAVKINVEQVFRQLSPGTDVKAV